MVSVPALYQLTHILSKISLIFQDFYRKVKFNINFLYFIIFFSNLVNGAVKYLQLKLLWNTSYQLVLRCNHIWLRQLSENKCLCLCYLVQWTKAQKRSSLYYSYQKYMHFYQIDSYCLINLKKFKFHEISIKYDRRFLDHLSTIFIQFFT